VTRWSRRLAVLSVPLTLLVAAAAGCGSPGTAAGPVTSSGSGSASGPGATTGTAAGPTSGSTPTGSTGAGSGSTGSGSSTTTSTPGSGSSSGSTTARPTTGSSSSSSSTPTGARTTPPPGATPTSLPASLWGKDWEVLPTGGAKVMALTFDAGGSNAGVASILATLRSTGTPATFFLTGTFATRYPSDARRIAATYRVGNHTATHVSLTTLGDTAVRSQITLGADQIRSATGVDPRPWFRFPNGDRNARTIADANQLGYAAIRWTVDSLGWQGTRLGGQSIESVTARVLAAARPGGIVLMHVGANPDDGTTLDADALPAVIAGLHARGYRLVTLDALRP
jgi:peptidoglycan/xylan/chitin deacetylase (PgdA/CDA1 family)